LALMAVSGGSLGATILRLTRASLPCGITGERAIQSELSQKSRAVPSVSRNHELTYVLWCIWAGAVLAVTVAI